MEQQQDFGVIGLGVMGRNFIMNVADKGFSVAGYDKDKGKAEHLEKETEKISVKAAASLDEFVRMVKPPRAIMLLVPAGEIIDDVIDELLPHLQEGDLVIDGGNSHPDDTEYRARFLNAKRIHFLGLGISGGAEGARKGPSLMPGGDKEAYSRVKHIFSSVAAKVNEEPCVTYLGRGSAGHFVKMVHNGIEYGLMQLIAESYDLMKRGLGMSNEELHEVYKRWNNEELASFLIEITAEIFTKKDDITGGYLVDYVLDAAKQKGTGKWTTQEAMNLQVPVPTIDMAVAMRDMSALKGERETAGEILKGPEISINGSREKIVSSLKNAQYFSWIATYAQGMALLKKASEAKDYQLNLDDVARIWRGGCIIRSAMLEDIRKTFKEKEDDVDNLMQSPFFSSELHKRQSHLRYIVQKAVEWGIPCPAMMTSLGYFDAFRSRQLPANLIQAQRDFFGSHNYERVDKEGTFHTEWEAGA